MYDQFRVQILGKNSNTDAMIINFIYTAILYLLYKRVLQNVFNKT
jgi:hypothetical protein